MSSSRKHPYTPAHQGEVFALYIPSPVEFQLQLSFMHNALSPLDLPRPLEIVYYSPLWGRGIEYMLELHSELLYRNNCTLDALSFFRPRL